MAKNITTFADFDLSLWQRFEVELQMRNLLCGGTPKSPSVIEAWINTLHQDEGTTQRLVEEAKAGMKTDKLSEEELVDLSQSSWNGFKRNDDIGLYCEGRTVKAMLKESANILRVKLQLTAFKARVAERVFVEDEEIPLDRTEADGFYEGFIHAMTPQGPIHALKRVDYVQRATLRFTVRVMDEPLVMKNADKTRVAPAAYLEAILRYGQESGYGSERSVGHGKFDLVALNPIVGGEAV